MTDETSSNKSILNKNVPKEKNNNLGVITGIGIGLAVVALGGGLAYYMYMKNKINNKKEELQNILEVNSNAYPYPYNEEPQTQEQDQNINTRLVGHERCEEDLQDNRDEITIESDSDNDSNNVNNYNNNEDYQNETNKQNENESPHCQFLITNKKDNKTRPCKRKPSADGQYCHTHFRLKHN